MEQVSVLSRNIYVINGDDAIEKYPLSVLEFICSKEIASQVKGNPNLSIDFEFYDYSLKPYDGEIPNTLQSDAEIIIKSETGIIEFKYL